MSLIKKYDGTTFNNVYAVNQYDGTNQKNKNVKPFDRNTIYLDGNGDYLTIPHSDDFNFGTGNFTMEFWAKPSIISPECFVLNKSAYTRYSPFIIGLRYNFWTFWASSNGTSWDIVNNPNLITGDLDVWQHIALVRNGNTFTLYKNGIGCTPSTSSASLWSNTELFNIGRIYAADPGYFNGKLSNLIISKGIARYTSNFTPSKNIPEVDQYTKLLITGESPIADRSGKIITIYGNTTIAKTYNTVYSDSNNAIYFDGNGDYLSLADSEDQNFGSGNFTIENWFNPIDLTGTKHLASQFNSNNSQIGFSLFYYSNKLALYFSSNGTVSNTVFQEVSWTPIVNTWYHIALVRNSATATMYVNGISLATSNVGASYSFFNSNQPLRIGAVIQSDGSLSATTPEYLSNMRISKGIARYTSNFNPLRTRTVLDSYTKLLITGESPIVDKTGKSVSVYGNTVSTKVAI